MKRLIAILMVFVGGMVFMTPAAADDAADVKAAALKLIAAYNAGDADAMMQYAHPDYSRFQVGGGLLVEGANKDRLKAALEGGLKINWQHRHLQVKVYGNTAITTGYLTGTITLPNSTTLQGPWRHSSVWMKQGGQWKRAHYHASQLLPAPSQ